MQTLIRALTVLVMVVFMLLVVISASGQDIPQPPSLTQDRFLLEIGKLQLQLSTTLEYVGTLQQRIRELSAENAKLKAGTEK